MFHLSLVLHKNALDFSQSEARNFFMFIINWNKVEETVKGERFQKILHR